eukprot:SAG25_NODE_9745_length_359_cov_1.200000_1_plen_35_part_10
MHGPIGVVSEQRKKKTSTRQVSYDKHAADMLPSVL